MCQEKKVGGRLALRIALMHRYTDVKITKKSAEWRLITASRNNTDNTSIKKILENKNGKENNTMEILVNKLALSYSRKLQRG